MQPPRRATELPPDILGRAAAGDSTAVRTVVEASYAYTRGLLFKLAGPSPDLEDLHQTVLLHLVQALPRISAGSGFTSFLGCIVINVLRDHRRRSKVRAAVSFQGGSEDLPTPELPSAPESRLDAAIRLTHCRRALQQLSENQRTAFILHHIYGHTVDEVATMTGSMRSTTRLRLYYGRKVFSRALAKEIWP